MKNGFVEAKLALVCMITLRLCAIYTNPKIHPSFDISINQCLANEVHPVQDNTIIQENYSGQYTVS